jgi:hypothetical protein
MAIKGLGMNPYQDPKTGIKGLGMNPYSTKSPVFSNQKQINALLARINSLTNQINREPMPVSLNLSGISAKARQRAKKAVNPYYAKEMSRAVKDAQLKRQERKQTAQLDLKDLSDVYKQALETSEIGRERTTEDVGQQLGEIARTEDIFQTDTGQQFDEDRRTQARELAQSGVTGGLGAQQTEAGEQARATQEERQTEEFGQDRVAQELFKARTFEDLSRSDVLAKTTKQKGTERVKVDLNSFLKQSSLAQKREQSAIAKARKAELAAQTSKYGRQILNRQIQAISDPGRRVATSQAYSSAF